MIVKNYNKTVSKIIDVVKTIAEETMNDAAKEIHENSLSADDDIVNTSVSGDGTWQRREFSNYNRVFAAISVENGNVLDVEPMSRYCKGCNLKE